MEMNLSLFTVGRVIEMIILKLLSSLLIFLTSTSIGYIYGKRFSDRLENLIYLEQCIKILETEVVYGAIPLPDALTNVYNKGKGKVSYIFEEIKNDLLQNKREGVYQSFLSVERKLYDNLHLIKEDVEIFLALGRVLGTSDRTDQHKNFILILSQISTQILDAKIERNKNEKLYRSLGVITGVGIIILLV